VVPADRVSGIASRLPRERQHPEPPEEIAGHAGLYMAPEQTGPDEPVDRFPKANLYALGITFYEMLTGHAGPFRATDPMEWVHCPHSRDRPTRAPANG